MGIQQVYGSHKNTDINDIKHTDMNVIKTTDYSKRYLFSFANVFVENMEGLVVICSCRVKKPSLNRNSTPQHLVCRAS